MSRRALLLRSIGLFASLVALSLPACSKGTLGAARVEVTLTGDTRTLCLQIWARSASGNTSFSGQVPRSDDSYTFAIQESAELVGEVTVGVNLFPTANCSGTPHHVSTQPALLERNTIAVVIFDLVFGGDGGTDGGPDAGDGGSGDGGPSCELSQCTAPPECTEFPASCGPSGCQYQALDAGSPCDGGQCNAFGACDRSCGSFSVGVVPCTDPRECTRNDVCFGINDCRGTCQTPPSAVCKRQLSTCETDGGCAFAPNNINSSCSDVDGGGRCDATGLCRVWFPFTPSNLPNDVRALTQPTQPWVATSTAGGCQIDTSLNPPGPTTANCGFLGVGEVVDDAGVEVAVFSATQLTVPAGVELRFVGTRPAVLAIFGDATIQGRILAAADTAPLPAGTGAGVCPSGDTSLAGHGGTGGGYRTEGGVGGKSSVTTAINGRFNAIPLRGGCPGGLGGGNNAGTRGVGGGALQLTVAGLLTVGDGGVLSVSGGGGSPGMDGVSGGGGGGSGGTILLEARQIHLMNCALTANGGGGGQGGKNAIAGVAGEPGSLTLNASAAGGSAGTAGGAGGDGASSANPATAGNNGSAGEAGGGGGGGLGLLRVSSSCRRVGTVTLSGDLQGSCPP